MLASKKSLMAVVLFEITSKHWRDRISCTLGGLAFIILRNAAHFSSSPQHVLEYLRHGQDSFYVQIQVTLLAMIFGI